MATLVENRPDIVTYINVSESGSKNAPTLTIQAGDWDVGDHVEAGIVFDTSGEQAPILTPTDARKLAKWLTRAADLLDGVKTPDKKNKHRHHYEQDDDDINNY